MRGELIYYEPFTTIMKELSIIISITPVTKMKKDKYTFIADPFTFTPSVEKSSAGNLFNCNQDITIECPNDDIINEFHLGRYAIVSLQDTSTRAIVVGTQDMPATITICPNLNSATLKIECKMLCSPFLSQGIV